MKPAARRRRNLNGTIRLEMVRTLDILLHQAGRPASTQPGPTIRISRFPLPLDRSYLDVYICNLNDVSDKLRVVAPKVNLSKSELRVLEVLWDDHPLTVGQMIERLQKQTRWHQSTIKTLLTRLVKKKAATRQRDGRRFFYSPLVQRETILAKESERLLNRFFDGEIAPLVAHFADRKQISKRDLEKIQMILSNLKDRDA